MPIITQQHNINNTYAIWRIEETEGWFLEQLQLSASEEAQLEIIKGWRRMEWLAVRKLVAELLPQPERAILVKDEHGKPHLHNSPLQVSISHSHELAAAMIGRSILGIDIQKIVEKIGRLAPRFLSPRELAFIHPAEQRIAHLHVCWCAKEALYKAYGKREIDFCEHLLLEPFEYRPEGGTFSGKVIKDAYEASFDLKYQQIQGCMLVQAVMH